MTRSSGAATLRTLLGCALAALGCCFPALAQNVETVHFESGDGKTELVAYLYTPAAPGPHPAVVALHGRTGLYSTKASGRYEAATLAPQKKMWGEYWASHGFAVLFVDTFGPRGYPQGFAAGTIRNRPTEINEITIRPLDAYAGLKYLRSRGDVIGDQIFLQGWSNGGSATLSSMERRAPGISAPTPASGFRAAISMYPACTQVQDHYGTTYRTYAPVLLLIGSADEEVRPANCENLAAVAKANGSALDFVLYPGAQHSYDTPVPARQGHAPNVDAVGDTLRRAEAFFQQQRPSR